MNLLARAAEYLHGKFEQHASVAIEYRRDGESVRTRAIVGNTVVEATDYNGFLLRSVAFDFTIRQTVLERWPDQPHPMRNDEIVYVPSQDPKRRQHIFLVNADALSNGHYVPADGHGVAWRIHTRRDRVVD